MSLVYKSTKHALPITITKSGYVRFSIQFLHIFHRRFANIIQVLSCKSNQQKLEDVKTTE